MKKHIALILITVLSSVQLTAQSPQGFNYQATVRNNAGELLVNQNANFQFTIVQGSTTGTSLYVETHTTQSDDLAQVALVIGQGSTVSGDFSQIDWSLGSYYLAIDLDIGSGYVSMGTTQLLSVPYALYADTAGNVEALQTQINELVLLTDADNDGYSENQGDCDDTNATVYPGATEDETDGIDNDCDGEVDETLGYEATFYHFHAGGGNVYPFADLMSSNTGYLIGDTTYTPYDLGDQSDFDVVMTNLINLGDGTDSSPDVGSFEFAGPITGDNCGQTWTHNASPGPNYYYLAVPNNSSFPENLRTANPGVMQKSCNGLNYNAFQEKPFTYNGEAYTLFKIQSTTGTTADQWGFK
jgi:hypothetical protein